MSFMVNVLATFYMSNFNSSIQTFNILTMGLHARVIYWSIILIYISLGKKFTLKNLITPKNQGSYHIIPHFTFIVKFFQYICHLLD
jgi:hypothetical protein